jgi:hypothetical protein
VLCVPPLATVTFDAAPAVFVRLNVAEVVPPDTLAVTVYAPAVALAVAVALVWPLASVAAGTLSLAEAPFTGTAVNVTVAPLTGLLLASVTVTASGLPNAVPTAVLCVPPLATLTFDAAPAVFVRLNVADVVPPETLAVTLYAPTMELAVAVTLATPEEFVIAVGLERVALAPDDGGVNVTVAPLTGLPPPSVTVACNVVANCVPTAALCVAPAVAATAVGTAAAWITGMDAPSTVMCAVREDSDEFAVNENATTPPVWLVMVSQVESLTASSVVPMGSTGSIWSVPAVAGSLNVLGPTKANVSLLRVFKGTSV